MKFTRRTIEKLKMNDVVLCPSVISNNRRKIYSNLKDRRQLGSMINASFIVRCRNCAFTDKMYASVFEVERTYICNSARDDSKISMHCKSTGHEMSQDILSKDIVQYKNKRDILSARNF